MSFPARYLLHLQPLIMDEGPPPFVAIEEETLDHVFDESSTSLSFDHLKLPSLSRSPSPSRTVPKLNGVHTEEKENGQLECIPPLPPEVKINAVVSPSGGIESFLEREEISRGDLPVDAIGLSPVVSREPSPSPSTQPVACLSNGGNSQQVEDSLEDDDEFGDFDEAPPPPEKNVDVDDSKVVDDEWSAFEASSSVNRTESKEQEEDDWAAFESSSVPTEESGAKGDHWSPEFDESSSTLQSTASLSDLNELSFSESIWECEEQDDMHEYALDLCAVLDKEDSLNKEKDDLGLALSGSSLWSSLRIVEDAHALKHEWSSSAVSTRLLAVLDMNPTLLTRRLPSSTSTSSTALSPTSSLLIPTPITSSNGMPRTVTLSTTSSSISHLAPPSLPSSSSLEIPSPQQTSTIVDSLAVPPVEFDWEKSTLTNPLTPQAISASSAMLDIDFLSGGKEGGPPKMISSDTTLQKDMEAFGLSTTVSSGGLPKVTSSTTSVLDSLLSSSSSRFVRPSELSLDARALHDSLPPLEYLSNPWISFPVRDPSQS